MRWDSRSFQYAGACFNTLSSTTTLTKCKIMDKIPNNLTRSPRPEIKVKNGILVDSYQLYIYKLIVKQIIVLILDLLNSLSANKN